MKPCTVLIGWDTRLKHCTAPDRMGCEEEGLPFSDWMRQENEAFTVRLLDALLDGSNVRLNWNIESDMNVHWIKF